MSNMSYCRFENTLSDLGDCFYNLFDKDLSKSEKEARENLIDLCRKMVDKYENDPDGESEDCEEDED